MRLIDENRLVDDITEHITTKAVSRVVAIIQGQPTVDAIKVVRCKDCKYLGIINKGPVYAYCSKHNHTFLLWEEDIREHFCAWGEREENETNRCG